jgi:hypothetical protein
MITSQKTNGTTDPALFARGGLRNPDVKIPESVLQFWAEADQTEAKTKAVRQELEYISLSPPPTFPKVDLPLAITAARKGMVTSMREFLATYPVEAAASAKDMAISLLKDLNDNGEIEFTPEVIAELKQIAEILLAGLPCNQQHITKQNDKDQASAASLPSSPPKKANGAAPVNPPSSEIDETGLAAFADPKKFQDAKRKMAHHADSPVLEQMNRDFAAGYIGSKFRVAKFDLHPRYPRQRHVEFLSKDDFINGVRHPMVRVPKFDKAGKQAGTTKEPRGAYWLNWAGRREFDAVTFKPGAPPIIEIKRDGRIHRTINTYSDFSAVPDHVDSAAKCAKYLAHVHDNIAGGDEALYKYTLDWMASGVQHPDDPARSALSLRGVPGCGKGVFALGYGHLFGRHFLHATHRDHVIGRFNAHQAETCLIFVDEALYAEIAADAQILKTMTSETTKLLERKGIDAIQIDNYARQIFATNAEHPIKIEHNDRLYPAIYVRENEAFANETDDIVKAEKRKAYFMPIIAELKNGGSEALLGLLLDRDIRGFNAEAIPETAERRQQKLNSASAGDKIIIEFAQDACLPGALPKRPWIARAHGEPGLFQTPGIFDVMKAHGGPKLARQSDTDLAKILKAWGFTSKHLTNGKAWEAPSLPDLRRAILTKYPAVEFDDRSEWARHVDTQMTA